MSLLSGFSIFFLSYSLSFFVYYSCEDYASNAVHDEIQHYDYMSEEEKHEAYSFYYNACTDAGGTQNMGDPVFL